MKNITIDSKDMKDVYIRKKNGNIVNLKRMKNIDDAFFFLMAGIFFISLLGIGILVNNLADEADDLAHNILQWSANQVCQAQGYDLAYDYDTFSKSQAADKAQVFSFIACGVNP